MTGIELAAAFPRQRCDGQPKNEKFCPAEAGYLDTARDVARNGGEESTRLLENRNKHVMKHRPIPNEVRSRIVPHKVTKYRRTKAFNSVVTIV